MLYQFDMGGGMSRYYLGISPVETYHGPHAYYMRKEAPPTPPVVGQWEVEQCGHTGCIASVFYPAAIIVKRDGKFGVLLRDKCFGMNDGARYGASSYPCVYDDIKIPPYGAHHFKRGNVDCGYIPVCKGGKWAILLLSGEPFDGKATSALAGPFVFNTAEEAEKWMEENKETVDISFALPCHPDKPVRFLLVADIHNSGTDGLDPTGCDAAIVAGDFIADTPLLPDDEYRKAINKTPFFVWCKQHTNLPVFLIPGNHDRVVEAHPEWIEWPENVIRLHTGDGVEENGIGHAADCAFVFKGIRIFAVPWSSNYSRKSGFLCSAAELAAKFAAIPDGLDILVIHCPPKMKDPEGASDKDIGATEDHFGSRAIRDAILAKKPRLAVCGHIHQGSHEPAKLGETVVLNVGRVRHKRDDTPAFSPAYMTFNHDGTFEVTPAQKLR